MILAVAGNETTRQAITHGMLAFLQHPAQWERWRLERPATTVDEVLRWTSTAVALQRTATEDVELGRAAGARGERVGCTSPPPTSTRRCSTSPALRHRSVVESTRHLRRRRLPLLHRGQPLPARAAGDVRRAGRRAGRHAAAGAAEPAPLVMAQRDQATAGSLRRCPMTSDDRDRLGGAAAWPPDRSPRDPRRGDCRAGSQPGPRQRGGVLSRLQRRRHHPGPLRAVAVRAPIRHRDGGSGNSGGGRPGVRGPVGRRVVGVAAAAQGAYA